MSHFTPVDRKGLTQILCYECINLKAVATNNIWMHFQRRLLSHVRNAHVLDEVGYATLSKDHRRHRKLHLMQVAEDMGRPPSGTRRSPVEFHAWIATERSRLGIDTSVGNWANKPLLYHLKTHPERFLLSMHIMSADRETRNRKAFALFPLRRTLVPRHVRFDQNALRSLLRLGGSENQKQTARTKRRKTEGGYVDDAAVVLKTRAAKRSKVELVDEKSQAFGEVLDLRAAGVRQRQCFDFAFTTDGVCVRLQYTKPNSNEEVATLALTPTRGIHVIDELKRVGSWNSRDHRRRGSGRPERHRAGAIHPCAATPRLAIAPVYGRGKSFQAVPGGSGRGGPIGFQFAFCKPPTVSCILRTTPLPPGRMYGLLH